jgi:hypothetical protein
MLFLEPELYEFRTNQFVRNLGPYNNDQIECVSYG